MFGFFKKNNLIVGNKFTLKSKNYFQVILTIITVDKNVLGIHLYDNYNKVDIMSHIPIYKKDFNRSNITFLGKENNIELFSLSGYHEWKEAKGGVFNIKIEDLLDSFTTNRLIFVKEENKNIREYSLLKQKGLATKAIFSEDGNDVIGLLPLYKRVLFPRIGYPEGDIIINDFEFINLGDITVQNNIVNIGYYDYSEILNGNNYDLEMFNFSHKNIKNELLNILHTIKNIDIDILLFKNEGSIGINDSFIYFDNNNYIFENFGNKSFLSKEESEILINKYIELLNKFILDKNIVINIDKSLIE